MEASRGVYGIFLIIFGKFYYFGKVRVWGCYVSHYYVSNEK